jgi:hypothetical protein
VTSERRSVQGWNLFLSFPRFLGRDLFQRILMVQSTENGTGDHLCFLLHGWLGRAPSRATSVRFLRHARPQTAVWAPAIVVANPFT